MNFTNISNLNQSLELDETTSAVSSYFSEAEASALVVVVVFLASVGFLLNVLLILSIILTDGFADAPANVFVLSLACADLCNWSAFHLQLLPPLVQNLCSSGQVCQCGHHWKHFSFKSKPPYVNSSRFEVSKHHDI